jgi:hypothetical protein
MIKIIDDRNIIPKLPSLPFVTEQDNVLYLYFRDDEDGVSVVNIQTGEQLIRTYEDIERAVQDFANGEKLVDIQIRIV